jgi:hypothetical protein
LDVHRAKKHNIAPDKARIPCPFVDCEKDFSTTKTFDKHLSKYHKDQTLPNPLIPNPAKAAQGTSGRASKKKAKADSIPEDRSLEKSVGSLVAVSGAVVAVAGAVVAVAGVALAAAAVASASASTPIVTTPRARQRRQSFRRDESSAEPTDSIGRASVPVTTPRGRQRGQSFRREEASAESTDSIGRDYDNPELDYVPKTPLEGITPDFKLPVAHIRRSGRGDGFIKPRLTAVLQRYKENVQKMISENEKNESVIDCTEGVRMELMALFSNTIFIRRNSRQEFFSSKVRKAKSAEEIVKLLSGFLDDFDQVFDEELKDERKPK